MRPPFLVRAKTHRASADSEPTIVQFRGWMHRIEKLKAVLAFGM
jgi:hypothetical protein